MPSSAASYYIQVCTHQLIVEGNCGHGIPFCNRMLTHYTSVWLIIGSWPLQRYDSTTESTTSIVPISQLIGTFPGKVPRAPRGPEAQSLASYYNAMLMIVIPKKTGRRPTSVYSREHGCRATHPGVHVSGRRQSSYRGEVQLSAVQTAAEERRPAVVRALALRGVRPGTVHVYCSCGSGEVASRLA